VSEVDRFGGLAHRYDVAIVAEDHLLLALVTSAFLFREGHGSHDQHGYHHRRSHHAKNRHITAHTNPTSLYGWALPVSLVGNIAGKGFLPVPWLTPARSSVTTGVTSRICRMAIFWKAPRESVAGNTRKLFRTSEPSTKRSRSYYPSTEPTLQPNTCDVRSCQRGQTRFFGEGRRQDYRPPILAIPHPLDARVDASRLDVYVPSGRVHAGKWIRTSRISLPSLMMENTNGS
jgi:hypothetical protein